MGKVNKPKSSFSTKPFKISITGKVNKAKQKVGKQQKVKLPLSDKITKETLLELNVNSPNLKNNNSASDGKHVLSYKLIKSQKSGNKIIKKKEKLNLKHTLLMKKIDTIKQLRKEEKIREKRKTTSVIGDTNPLHDALPSLELLLKNKKDATNKLPKPNKTKKGIEKAKQRKKAVINEIDLFKKAMKDKSFKKNPFEIISSHIQAVVEQERSKIS